ncbi:hypothetical protein [Lacticaseibacillus hegangensis]|uniref:Uncharacterized protein n=1 Tax=Lacticaseibacillus hegangensis TaxID=2486010 RepID=A0ABW4CVB6_9LACO|nr:hypothetical protein [Lacticaseibacillus hegangensis]
MDAVFRIFEVALYRELSVGALILFMIIAYYFRYLHFAKMSDTRLHRRWLKKLVSGTRRLLIVLVIALIGLIVYDRLLSPQIAASASHIRTSSSSKKRGDRKSSKSSSKENKASTKSKRKKEVSYSASGEVINATERSLTTSEYGALLTVQNYFKKNPNDSNAAPTYRYRGIKRGNAGIQVDEIGGYRKYGKNQLMLEHLYWVYPSGQFDVKR